MKTRERSNKRKTTGMNAKMTRYETEMCEITGIPKEEWSKAKQSHPELRYMYFQDFTEFQKYITEDYGSSETESRRYLHQALKAKLMGIFYDKTMDDYFSGCGIDTYKMLLTSNIPKIKAWVNSNTITGGGD